MLGQGATGGNRVCGDQKPTLWDDFWLEKAMQFPRLALGEALAPVAVPMAHVLQGSAQEPLHTCTHTEGLSQGPHQPHPTEPREEGVTFTGPPRGGGAQPWERQGGRGQWRREGNPRGSSPGDTALCGLGTGSAARLGGSSPAQVATEHRPSGASNRRASPGLAQQLCSGVPQTPGSPYGQKVHGPEEPEAPPRLQGDP